MKRSQRYARLLNDIWKGSDGLTSFPRSYENVVMH